MKKNKMMRLASVLLVLVLMTTCVIGGTFAKYTTTDDASDTARVAKWGVAVSVNGNLFGTAYAENEATSNADSIVASSTNVASAGTDNVVAPGTENSTGWKVAITGTPEVAYEITATDNGEEAEEIFLAAGNWGVMVPAHGLNDATAFTANTYYTLSGNDYTKATAFASGTTYYELIDEVAVEDTYYPLDWTVTAVAAENGSFAAVSATRLAEIQAAIIADLDAGAGEANENATGSYVLTWKWDFSDNDSIDGADTILGNLMAANGNAVAVKKTDAGYTKDLEAGVEGDYNLNVAFGLDVTVTQVD